MNKHMTINAFINHCKDKGMIDLEISVELKKEIRMFLEEENKIDNEINESLDKIRETLLKHLNK